MAARAAQRVFVYGTLRPGMANAGLAGAVGATPARLEGFALYHLEPEGYPAILPGTGVVVGEVIEVDDLEPLDALEGTAEEPPLYLRRRCRLADGSEAWVYVYGRAERLLAGGATRVASGDWTDTFESKES